MSMKTKPDNKIYPEANIYGTIFNWTFNTPNGGFAVLHQVNTLINFSKYKVTIFDDSANDFGVAQSRNFNAKRQR